MSSRKEEIDLLRHQVSCAFPGALARLYSLMNINLKAYIFQLSDGDKHKLAKDIVQELFLWIAKNHQQLESIKNLEPYLFRAVKFNYLKEVKKIRKVRAVEDLELKKIVAENIGYTNSYERDITALDILNKKKLWLNETIKTLPKIQYEALYLKFCVELNYNEMSEVLNVSNQICRNYVFRALSTLRKIKSNSRI